MEEKIKMKQFKEIKGETFEVLFKPTKKLENILRTASHPWNPSRKDALSIWDAYVRPSDRKEAIYNYWDWFFSRVNRDLMKDYFIIASHTCHFFTIAVRVDDNLFYISPTYKYMIPLSSDLLDKCIPNLERVPNL